MRRYVEREPPYVNLTVLQRELPRGCYSLQIDGSCVCHCYPRPSSMLRAGSAVSCRVFASDPCSLRARSLMLGSMKMLLWSPGISCTSRPPEAISLHPRSSLRTLWLLARKSAMGLGNLRFSKPTPSRMAQRSTHLTSWRALGTTRPVSWWTLYAGRRTPLDRFTSSRNSHRGARRASLETYDTRSLSPRLLTRLAWTVRRSMAF